MNIEIDTYWNVETLYYVFNAIASVMSSADFSGLLKLVFLFALGIGMFVYVGNKQLEMGTWLIQALIFVTVLNLPIATVILKDRTNLEPPRTVSHVPFALAIMAQTTNLVFGYFTRTYETVFGVPEELGLQKGDVGFGHRILKQVNRATIQEPGLRSDLMQYIKECTLYDIKDGVITPQQIVGNTDAWNTIFDNTNPARFVTYNTLQNPPKTDSCSNVARSLKTRVNDAEKTAQSVYGKNAFPRNQSADIAANLFMNSVGKSYDWILDNAQSSSEAMRQAMFNNIWKDAGSELPALMNDPARIAELNAMAGAAQAARQADGSNSTLSLLAQETLPHMRNWIEAIIYALFPIIVVLMVVVSTEGAKRILGGYFMALAWIGLWPVLFAIINHLSLMHLHHKLQALTLAKGVPFQLMDVFDATLSDEQAMIGYMVVLVPFIAGAIIKLGQGGLMGVADKMLSSFSTAGASAGSSFASGNHSMGQTAMDSASINTTAMHKHNSHIGLLGGGSTMDRPDGSIGTLSANGSFTQQSSRNQMLTSMGYDDRSDASQNQEAHMTNILSHGTQTLSSQSSMSGLSHIHGHDNTRGTTQNQENSVSHSEQAGFNQSYGTGQSMSTTHGRNSSFEQSAGANDALGISIGGHTGGTPMNTGQYNPKEATRIAQTMEQNGASKKEIDHALNNYRHQTMQPNGSGLNIGANLNTYKTYTAGHSRQHNVHDQYTQDEQGRTEHHFGASSAQSQQDSSSAHSSQIDRDAHEATRANTREHSTINDLSKRQEIGTGQRVSQGRTKSFTVHKDLLSDPQLLKAVANRHGMNPVRFEARYSENQRVQMVQGYLEEKEMIQQTRTMPNMDFSGYRQPNITSPSESVIDKQHQQNIAQVGNINTTPIDVNTDRPAMIDQTRKSITNQLDSSNTGGISTRAQPFKENVHAWASPDKSVGEGRANPMAVVEDTEIRDVKDYASKVYDKLTGGDGTADGEKLTVNMKDEKGPELPIQQIKNSHHSPKDENHRKTDMDTKTRSSKD